MNKFPMAAKTMAGLEETLAEELRQLGATDVRTGTRVVTFDGDLAMMYRANLACRTALSVLKPIYKFTASSDEGLYQAVKEFDWSKVMNVDMTFSIDTVSHSNEFTHTRFVTYRVKDAICDYFRDRLGGDKRPGVRLNDADVQLNVHIDGERVTLSLNSSGEPLFKRGWRVAQTEAPINEVLAAGIILMSGYKGECPFVDPMCGSGTFLIEAALIARNIWPGCFDRSYAFQKWADYDEEIFHQVKAEGMNDLREPQYKIYGADISPRAVDIAMQNILSAKMDEYIILKSRPLIKWEEAPANGVPGILITNPPYGERLSNFDLERLYATLGTKLKHVFLGYHAWIISSNDDLLAKIGLTPSIKLEMNNGGLECQLREYVIFEGTKRDFRQDGGKIKEEKPDKPQRSEKRRLTDPEWRMKAHREGLGGASKEFGKRKSDEHVKRDFKKRDSRDQEERDFKKRDSRDNRFTEEKPRRMGWRKNDTPKEEAPMTEAEQLLGRHRNPYVLKNIGQARPQLPPDSDKVKMRPRRKKSTED